MKCLTLLLSLVLLASCAQQDISNQPTGPSTYPETGYRAIKQLAARSQANEISRLVGWDTEYYYFDWSKADAAIARGSGRVLRSQFDTENRGSLTLAKGLLTAKNGQVRTLILE